MTINVLNNNTNHSIRAEKRDNAQWAKIWKKLNVGDMVSFNIESDAVQGDQCALRAIQSSNYPFNISTTT